MECARIVMTEGSLFNSDTTTALTVDVKLSHPIQLATGDFEVTEEVDKVVPVVRFRVLNLSHSV